MRLKTRLNFIEPWSTIIPEVAKQCGMSVENYCARAVMLVTKQGLEGGKDGSGSEESELVDGQVLSNQGTDSPALADERDTGTT